MTNFIKCTQCPCYMNLIKSQYGYYYSCVCGETHGAHQASKEPLGIPTNKETRKLRIKAHFYFNLWYKNLRIKRRKAYQKLSKIMNLPQIDTHIGCFNKEQCLFLIDYLIRDNYIY